MQQTGKTTDAPPLTPQKKSLIFINGISIYFGSEWHTNGAKKIYALHYLSEAY